MDAERSASIHPAAQNRPVFVVLVKPGRLLIRQSAPHTPESTSSTRGRSVIGWALFGLLVSVALMGAKWFAYALTGSSAILSDAMESGVNILTSAFVLFAVWLAEQPRDDEHPYGHGRVEYFSAAFEGALIAFAALSIGAVALWRALDPQPLERLELGMLVQGVVSAASFAAGQLLIARGRALRSPSIQADGEHIRADGVTTVGTLIGVLMVWWTGWLWLDALVAGLVALWLGWCGYRVVRSSIGGLMDEADPELLERVAATLHVPVSPDGSRRITPRSCSSVRLCTSICTWCFRLIGAFRSCTTPQSAWSERSARSSVRGPR